MAGREGAHAPSDHAPLDVVQNWFQHVIRCPGGVEAGIESEWAKKWIRLDRKELEKVVRSTRKFSARERLSVYANAYYARLLECLGESFPVLRRTVGEELFNQFAFGYLQDYPSRSYTLDRLADHFADYLAATRPARETEDGEPVVDWADLLIDLARFEWCIGEVFDGEGPETRATLSFEELSRVPPERWMNARLVPSPSLRFVEVSHRVNDYFTACRHAGDDEDVPIPEAASQRIVLHRRDYVVRRYELSVPEHRMLEALVRGASVGDAIELAAASTLADDETLAKELNQWFRWWTAEGFFERVVDSTAARS